MKIQKRDGRLEQLSFDKIIYRMRKLCNDASLGVLSSIDPDIVAQRVVSSIYDGVTSVELDEEAARIAVGMTENIEFAQLASRIIISNLHKSTHECFSEVMESLYNNVDKNGDPAPILADDIIEIIRRHKNVLNFAINYSRDYMFDYFGFKTLEKSYLMKKRDPESGKMVVVERPQHLYMRVAIGIHKNDIESALKTYELISQHFYTHASPTLFNSGTKLANMASCFTEDTIIATVNRGPVKIKDVQIGDQVITHKGNVKSVVQVHKNMLGERKLYEINIAKTAPIKVTGNHKLWVIKAENQNLKRKERKQRVTYDIEFVREFLKSDKCELLSTEYKNMKTKLQFKCVCGRIANTSFESIFYHNIRCNNRQCIYKRKTAHRQFNDPEWVSVTDLKNGDYVCIPNKTNDIEYDHVLDIASFQSVVESNPNKKYKLQILDDTVFLKSYNQNYSAQCAKHHLPVSRFWRINEDFSKLVGVFYGDGHIINNRNREGNQFVGGIGITIDKRNEELIKFCIDVGSNLFGTRASIHRMKDQNIIQVLFNSPLVGEIFKHLFGMHFHSKKIWKDMFKWESRLIKAMLEGLVSTDGCVTTNQIVTLQMSNVKFMRDIYYLLRNNNIDASYGKSQKQKNGTVEHVQVSIPKDEITFSNVNKYYTDQRMSDDHLVVCKNQYSPRVKDGFKFLKFESEREITENLPEYVYTLGVEDDHSYNVGGIIAQNCFLIGTDDNIEGIFKTITDCAYISKVGGGIGVHVSNIRAKGSVIRGTNGISDGIIPMLKVYNNTSTWINQSGRRKGSFAMYLEPWHADISEFLDLKKNQGHDDVRARDLFYAIWMPDLFMKTVEQDGDWYLMCPDECPGLTDCYGADFENLYNRYVEEKRYKRVVKAQEIWRKIMDSQIETGVPYIAYKDAVNKKCNQKNLGTIKSSNLCVAPETMILTSKGYFPIQDLEGQQVNVWNGQEFTQTTVMKTGENVELLKVNLSNGVQIECTPYHKFYIVTGKRPSEYPRLKQIEAKDLKKEMRLIKSSFPVIKDGSNDFPYPYEHGLFSADGTYEHNTTNTGYCNDTAQEGKLYCGRHRMYQTENDSQSSPNQKCLAPIGKGLPRITLYGEKKLLQPFLKTRLEPCDEDGNGRINCRLPPVIKDKYEVPINCNLDIKLRWFEGLCDGDGCIIKSDRLTGIQVGSIDKYFLTDVLYMLQTMGCDPKINFVHEEGYRSMPDGKGGHELYYCQKTYRLLLTSYDVAHLCTLGFSPKRLKVTGVFPKKNAKHWIQVEEVKVTKRIADTYCFKEEKRGMGIFNGVLTGQCSEISLYSDHKSYAVCNLCSIALPKYVKQTPDGPVFDFDHLKQVAEHVVLALNCVIDNTFYPTPETRETNFKHRPLGIGVQGLADVYMMMRMPFESAEAKHLNKEIFEALYYGTISGSIKEAQKYGKYESFDDSPFSKGLLQFDLAKEFDNINLDDYITGRWDWDALKAQIKEHGIRNSMLTALMPTASTAQIMGNSECFEPIDSCIFKRRVLSGEYLVVNKHLVADLIRLGLWSKEMKDTIIAQNGSIANIPEIPQTIKDIYKNVWEISMKSVIEQARDRGVFVDQMQSMNLFMSNPNYKKLTSMHFYAWKNGLKTGMYYLRSKASSSAGKFSIDPELEKKLRDKVASGESLGREEEKMLCSIDNKEECMMCSS